MGRSGKSKSVARIQPGKAQRRPVAARQDSRTPAEPHIEALNNVGRRHYGGDGEPIHAVGENRGGKVGRARAKGSRRAGANSGGPVNYRCSRGRGRGTFGKKLGESSLFLAAGCVSPGRRDKCKECRARHFLFETTVSMRPERGAARGGQWSTVDLLQFVSVSVFISDRAVLGRIPHSEISHAGNPRRLKKVANEAC